MLLCDSVKNWVLPEPTVDVCFGFICHGGLQEAFIECLLHAAMSGEGAWPWSWDLCSSSLDV